MTKKSLSDRSQIVQTDVMMAQQPLTFKDLDFKEFTYDWSYRKFLRIWGEWPFNLCGFKSILSQVIDKAQLTARNLRKKLGYKLCQKFEALNGSPAAAQRVNQPIVTIKYHGDEIHGCIVALPGITSSFEISRDCDLNKEWRNAIYDHFYPWSGKDEYENTQILQDFITALGKIIGADKEDRRITLFDALLELQRNKQTIVMTTEVKKDGSCKTSKLPWNVPHFNAAKHK
ncbi:MAG: hypothetical protein LBI81_00300 [Puniceicoccales bacterium]|nr:hypothetical protein [Puniceicoccales bacterium]